MQQDAQHATNIILVKHLNISLIETISMLEISKIKKTTNGIFQHLKANKKHKIDWESIYFIDSEKHWLKRKIKESLYINALNPKEELCSIMNLEKGLSIHNCWKYFNDEIKTQTLKRLASAA